VADGLLTGGLETTASTLGMGALLLLRSPGDRVRLAGDPTFVPAYVEELLRYVTAVQVAFPRFARHDVDLAGSLVHRGDVVLCSLSAAGRDPRVGDHPDRFDPAAARIPQLAFGYGIHRCVVAEPARLELRLALSELCQRLPDLRLAVAEHELAYRPLALVYGLTSIPVTLAAR
jgi:cytochrome P450